MPPALPPPTTPSALLLLHCASSPNGSVIARSTNMWPGCRAIQDSIHVSNSSQNNCRVNEHTARNDPPGIMDVRHSCWKAFMQSWLMLIISHSVIEEAVGGTPRTHLAGLAVNKAGGRVVADWLPGLQREFTLNLQIHKCWEYIEIWNNVYDLFMIL